MKSIIMVGLLFLLMVGCNEKESDSKTDLPQVTAVDQITAGRYLVTVGGCNDCHTHGYMVEGMKIPEDDWLTGSPLGWQGPWGTSYPANLRLRVHELDEDQWVKLLKNGKGLPPMPWENVNHISDPDARAIYAYIKSLGNKGGRMPFAVAPDAMPETPYLSMYPQNLPTTMSNQ